MASALIALLLTSSSLAQASVASSVASAANNSNCAFFTIPLKNISAPSFKLSFEIQTQYDVNDWTINEARRDSATVFNPIAGPSTTTGDFSISARFCTPVKPTNLSHTVLVMTHGLGADKTYWDPSLTLAGGAQYSLTQAALARGYSVFTYDRLGTGQSTKADPHNVVQFPIQVEILAALTRLLLAPASAYTLKTPIKSAFHFGHSYGSFVAASLAAQYPELASGISLSGYSGLFDYFAVFIAGWQSRIAAQLNPTRWGKLQSGYLTPVDIYADSYEDFKSPFFDHAVAEWVTSTKSPYAVGELATLGQTFYNFSSYTKPVQVYSGRFDMSGCGGQCEGFIDGAAAIWTHAKPLSINGDFLAGHSVNLHYNASVAFKAMLDFVDQNV
ncbi:Alpha/Beta hydrolase protein [Mycena alexandri]|uniref:Alpha/Beta hydrolase protein n=1 Tax=Mycena alexandri TaxID=1745969 RepID=A0AAD6TAH2_9AGAR|nr:Alpha/Beta hydrolase protein [Mycena alexandri]